MYLRKTLFFVQSIFTANSEHQDFVGAMIPFIFWRVGLALLATLAAFLLSRPMIEMLLNAIRSRLDKRVRCGALRLINY